MPDPTIFDELQKHTTERANALALPASARDLCRDLRMALVHASNGKKLVTPPKKIHEYVKLLDEPPPQVLKSLVKASVQHGAFCIVGGEKNQDRDKAVPHFERSDGAWFDFSIIVRDLKGKLELLAYDFEIRMAAGMGVPFLRFDLNHPGHGNEKRELRCHLHPGHDDILVPAPLMSPFELLALFIEGIRPLSGRDPRAPTDFEVDWLRTSLTRACGMAEKPAT
jgi:hypothetical protein